jgi:hypothetical protein
MANMAITLAKIEKVEKEVEKKAAEVVAAKKKADAEEAEQKKKEAKAENDRVRKARVRALAESKKDKPVDKTTEPGEGSEGRKECDSYSKKGWKCEWITVSHPLS